MDSIADSYSIEPESEPRPHYRLLSSDESYLDTDIEKHIPTPAPLIFTQCNTPRYGHIIRLLLPFLTGILLTLLATHLASTLLTISTSTSTNTNTTDSTLLHHPLPPNPHSNSTSPTHPVPSTWLTGACGPTPSHALSQSCHFSPILHAWLPPSCLSPSDLADEEEMHSLYTFDWWADAAHTKPLEIEEVMMGEREEVFTGIEWHVVHCVYAWKRMSRALIGEGVWLDSVVASLEHTDHCGRVILGWEELRAKGVGSRVVRKFPECSGGIE